MKTAPRSTRTLSIILALLLLCLAGCGSTAESDAAEVSSAASAQASLPENDASAVTSSETASDPAAAADQEAPAASESVQSVVSASAAEDTVSASETAADPAAAAEQIVTVANVTGTGIIDATELFTSRDLTQTPDLTDAQVYTLADGQDIQITQEGVYVLQGSASGVTVYVETPEDADAKVQIVLDGANITNDDFPCIYVREADKVFVTTTDTENALSVTGTFSADGETNTDGVIFSRSDLVLNGTGSLTVSSSDNGIVCKDDLKITGGTYSIDAASKTLEANDSIVIADGVFLLEAGTDALHSENDEDDTLGYIYICGGTFTIHAGDDGIHAVSAVEIDGGDFTITAAEGIEGTYLQINSGNIVIEGQDDGINGAWKSNAYNPTIEITGGSLSVTMASGDTDGIDCNGDLIITGGTIDVTGQSAFDCDGIVTFTGGSVTVNGQQVSEIPLQMMGGGRGMG